MAQESFFQSFDAFRGQFAGLIAELHTNAQCRQWGLSAESFARSLQRSAAKRFGTERAGPGEVEAYLKSLHLEDLALACACSEGSESAWDFFVANYRPELRKAATAILRQAGVQDETRSYELADSLPAELYGIRSDQDDRRKSLFEYFHGRSKLSTWLRAVLAQRQVDSLRASARIVSLESEDDSKQVPRIAESNEPAAIGPDRKKYLARFQRALMAAFENLEARERLLLALYYVDQLTLAEIGRTLREHESTVSRHLERIRQSLRECVTARLKQGAPSNNGSCSEPPLDDAQIELVFEYALEEWPFDLSKALSASHQVAEPPAE